MEKKFSIVFPTRERVELLDKCLRSIAENSYEINDVEALIAVDDDDYITQDYVQRSKWPFVKWNFVKRSLNFSRDYYTFLAKQSTGKWIITVNDDCEFVTKNWDYLVEKVLNQKPGVVYGWAEDELGEWRAKGHGNYCCFPLQGRVGFEALGYIFPADIPTWGADIWAKNLYDQVGSVAELPITIRHHCHHNKTREQDEVSKRIQNNQVGFDVRPSYTQVNILLAALKKEVTCEKI